MRETSAERQKRILAKMDNFLPSGEAAVRLSRAIDRGESATLVLTPAGLLCATVALGAMSRVEVIDPEVRLFAGIIESELRQLLWELGV